MAGSSQPDRRVRGGRLERASRSRIIAVGVFVATLGLSLVAIVLILLGRSADVGPIFGFRGFAVLFALTFGTLGVLINTRVPGNRIGYLFAILGLASAVQDVVAAYVVYAILVSRGSLPWGTALAWVVTWNWVPLAGIGTSFLVLLFPTGHLPSPRWRPVAWLAAAGIIVTSLALALTPGPIMNASYVDNPLGWQDAAAQILRLAQVGFVVLIAAILLSALSMVVRFRRAVGVERAQLKWLMSAAIFAGIVMAGPGTMANAAMTGTMLTNATKAGELLTILAILSIPLAAGVAILRYHLYEIDRIVSRTIAYAAVTGILTVVFVTVIIGLQAVLAAVTSGPAVSVAVSTLVVLAIFQPVLRRVRDTVDRRFDRARYDAERTVGAFSERLRQEVDLGTVMTDLSDTTRTALAPAALGVWLRSAGRR